MTTVSQYLNNHIKPYNNQLHIITYSNNLFFIYFLQNSFSESLNINRFHFFVSYKDAYSLIVTIT